LHFEEVFGRIEKFCEVFEVLVEFECVESDEDNFGGKWPPFYI
jgi:hypothetical protein